MKIKVEKGERFIVAMFVVVVLLSIASNKLAERAARRAQTTTGEVTMPPEDDPRDERPPTREEFETYERTVSESELVTMCVLLSASKPHPGREKFVELTNRIARSYGYKDWTDFYGRAR